jgi:hypothetical protein
MVLVALNLEGNIHPIKNHCPKWSRTLGKKSTKGNKSEERTSGEEEKILSGKK